MADLNKLLSNVITAHAPRGQPLANVMEPLFQRYETEYGLPSGLLHTMAELESRYNPQAKSRRGAQGLFQFMPGTAKELGIDPNDPLQSTEGAARYLAKLNKHYKGDWNRTLAAYNWGMGNLARQGMQNMPGQTRNYLEQTLGRLQKEINPQFMDVL